MVTAQTLGTLSPFPTKPASQFVVLLKPLASEEGMAIWHLQDIFSMEKGEEVGGREMIGIQVTQASPNHHTTSLGFCISP